MQERVGCIVIKDLSRLGRDFITMQELVEKIFPERQVRLIAINDNLDSAQYQNDLPGLDVVFRNLMNWYSSINQSEKVNKVLQSMRTAGEYVSPSHPYGFLKDQRKLMVDPEAAEIVKRIFQMTIDGMGRSEIARKLNQEGILSPGDYKRSRKCAGTGEAFQRKTVWTPAHIVSILREESYLGTVVTGKFYRPEMGIPHVKAVKKENWTRMENAHEAIVSQEDFIKAAQTFCEIKTDFTKKSRLYSGILYCGHCGHTLKARKARNQKWSYYCDFYRVSDAFGCPHQSYREEDITKVVDAAIENQIYLCCNLEEVFQRFKRKKQCIETAYEDGEIESQMNSLHLKKQRGYEKYRTGGMEEKEFIFLKNDINGKLSELQKRKEESRERGEKQKMLIAKTDAVLSQYEKWKEPFVISKELVDALIGKIEIFDACHMKIQFKFLNGLETLIDTLEKEIV